MSTGIRLLVDRLTVRRATSAVVAEVSFAASAGERLAVVGPNGAGKSTLLRTLAGLQRHEGQIAFEPDTASSSARRSAYLPQQATFHWPMLVADVIALGRIPHGWRGGALSTADRTAIEQAICATGLEDYAQRRVDTLSGGEQARVALARALAVEAPVLLADEPVAALDARHQLATMAALATRADRGVLVIAVLHDLTLAARWASRVIMLDRGRTVADGGPESVLTAERLEAVYQVRFDVDRMAAGLTIEPRR